MELLNCCPPTLALCVLVALISRATVLDQYSMPRSTDPPSLLFLSFHSLSIRHKSIYRQRVNFVIQHQNVGQHLGRCAELRSANAAARRANPSTQKTEASMATDGITVRGDADAPEGAFSIYRLRMNNIHIIMPTTFDTLICPPVSSLRQVCALPY